MEETLPLILHYDGATWARVHVGRPKGDAFLRDVVVRPNGEVWVVGSWSLWTPERDVEGGLVYRYDGSNWRRVPVPDEVTELRAASASGATALWAVGFVGDPLWHPAALRWDGSAWHVYRLPERSNDSIVSDVVSLGHGRVWAVGSAWYDEASDMLDGVYVARWTGARWSVARHEPAAVLSGVDGGRGGAMFVVGQMRPGFRAMAMRRGPEGWHRVAVPAPPHGSALLGVDVRTPGDAWAVGWREGTDGYEDPLAMRWDGSGWVRVAVPAA
jgi:hypothetical protein